VNNLYGLISYPKSGNTWVRILLANYLNNSSSPVDINSIGIGSSIFNREEIDDLLGFDTASLTEEEIAYYLPDIYRKWSSLQSELCILKCHSAYIYNRSGVPVFPSDAMDVLYIVRNPLDVAISFAHHNGSTLDEIIDVMNNPAAILGSLKSGPSSSLPQLLNTWSNHLSGWLDAPNLRIKLVRYEDLHANPYDCFSEILTFIGIEPDQERVIRTIELSKIEKLQEQEQKDRFKEKSPVAASFFRKGKVGDWQRTLTPAQVEKILKDHGEAMARIGYQVG
jgi:hypothetical protein